MAKKNGSGKRPTGTAGIAVTEDLMDSNDSQSSDDQTLPTAPPAAAKPTKAKLKEEPASNGNFGIGEIRKAAAFANSIGGLDKAIALLQILKVAKEVQ